MKSYLITSAATADRADILRYSHREYGDEGRRKYALLITASIRAAARDPGGLGSRAHPELGDEIFSFHLANAKDSARQPGDKVLNPRHVILYRNGADMVYVLRILHDAMELKGKI